MQAPVLATDLDGTLIPLDGNEQNRRDLGRLQRELHEADMRLAYVSGRHYASVCDAIEKFALPQPDWILCDVGTSIYSYNASSSFIFSDEFANHLATITEGFPTPRLREALSSYPGLRLQEEEKQARFKLSFYADHDQMADLVAGLEDWLAKSKAPYSIVASQDPFTGDGLIDFLPNHVAKGYALQWWAAHHAFDQQQIIYAGDSGNDLDAIARGFRSILVANAQPAVLQEAQRLHAASGWSGRLFAAPEPATSGVLAGLRHFRALGYDSAV